MDCVPAVAWPVHSSTSPAELVAASRPPAGWPSGCAAPDEHGDVPDGEAEFAADAVDAATSGCQVP